MDILARQPSLLTLWGLVAVLGKVVKTSASGRISIPWPLRQKLAITASVHFITAFLKNGGKLEKAAGMTNHVERSHHLAFTTGT